MEPLFDGKDDLIEEAQGVRKFWGPFLYGTKRVCEFYNSETKCNDNL